jgi:hypothetical protein
VATPKTLPWRSIKIRRRSMNAARSLGGTMTGFAEELAGVARFC